MKITTLVLSATFFIRTCILRAKFCSAVKGAFTVDSVSKAKLSGSVSILNARDSVLRKFTYADDNGVFSVSGLPAGRYLLFITYPGYDNKMTPLLWDRQTQLQTLGNVGMNTVAKTLNEVTVKSTPRKLK
jgi:hypothetical protein